MPYPIRKLDGKNCMSNDKNPPAWQHDGNTVVETERPKLKKPSMFKVVLLNDDYTPMEFVVELLEKFFSKTRENATRIMLSIHTDGKGVCGIYTKDVAETKAGTVNQYSRDHQHPLLCEVEPCNDEEE
ncbi:MAG: ATP-dependent Clp protease adapter ClpS [Porticoccaceae bacterium]|nr:ATP-dependent Clp protease adapter ClpS [Porticoccaceae bacterium]